VGYRSLNQRRKSVTAVKNKTALQEGERGGADLSFLNSVRPVALKGRNDGLVTWQGKRGVVCTLVEGKSKEKKKTGGLTLTASRNRIELYPEGRVLGVPLKE